MESSRAFAIVLDMRKHSQSFELRRIPRTREHWLQVPQSGHWLCLLSEAVIKYHVFPLALAFSCSTCCQGRRGHLRGNCFSKFCLTSAPGPWRDGAPRLDLGLQRVETVERTRRREGLRQDDSSTRRVVDSNVHRRGIYHDIIADAVFEVLGRTSRGLGGSQHDANCPYRCTAAALPQPLLESPATDLYGVLHVFPPRHRLLPTAANDQPQRPMVREPHSTVDISRAINRLWQARVCVPCIQSGENC
jgi:hypothetical protein